MSLTVHTLPNGLRVIVAPTATSELVTFGALVGMGNAHTCSPEVDILRQSLVDEHWRRPEAAGLRLSSETTIEHTWFELTSLRDASQMALEVLQATLMTPAGDDTAQRAATRVMRMRGQYSDHVFYEAVDRASHDLFAPHPYGTGSFDQPEQVPIVDGQCLATLHARHCQPNTTVLVITGSITGRMEQALQDGFETWPNGRVTVNIPPVTPNMASVATYHRPGRQVQVAMTFSAPSYGADGAEATQLLAEILGGKARIQDGRLRRAIRFEYNKVYDVFTEYMPYSLAGSFRIFTATTPDQVVDVVRLILRELRRLEMEDIPTAELNRVQLRLCTSLAHRYQISSIRARSLTQSLAYAGRLWTWKEEAEALKKVTSKHVGDLLAKLAPSTSLNVTLVGPVQAGTEAAIKAMRAGDVPSREKQRE